MKPCTKTKPQNYCCCDYRDHNDFLSLYISISEKRMFN